MALLKYSTLQSLSWYGSYRRIRSLDSSTKGTWPVRRGSVVSMKRASKSWNLPGNGGDATIVVQRFRKGPSDLFPARFTAPPIIGDDGSEIALGSRTRSCHFEEGTTGLCARWAAPPISRKVVSAIQQSSSVRVVLYQIQFPPVEVMTSTAGGSTNRPRLAVVSLQGP